MNIEDTNVVFINMPLRETAVPNTTPQGPLLLATNLRNNYGVNATVIDLNGYRIKDQLAQKHGLPNGRHLTDEETFNLIKRHFEVHGEPDLVGFSGKITTLRWQEKVAKMIRQLAPDTFLVSGNGLATELKLGLFNYIPELDGVARSEGDDVIVKIAYDAKIIKELGLASAINSGKLAPYYVGEIGRRHRFLYEGDRPSNLDNIPFADLDLLKEDVFGNRLLEYYIGNAVWGTSANNSSATSFTMKRSTTFVSSRGCPYACAFCFRGAQGERNYGMRSPKNLVEEFKLHMEKYGVDFIGMPDDNFGVDYQRIVELVPLLKPLKMRWGTHTRLDESAGLRPKAGKPGEYIFEDPKRIDLMAEAGCVYIGFGAESASPSVLKAMNKGGFILKNGITDVRVDGKVYSFPRTMIEGIKNCDYAGIHANCTWIMAYPAETLEDLKISVAFIKWQEDFYTSTGKLPDSVNRRMFTATWYPGTAMLHHPKVTRMLNEVFGINFNPLTREPICDENFHQYVLELDDATKLLHNPQTGEPLNFSDMPMDTFLKAREYVDCDETFKILEM
ncbi:MAG: radical SAM protein [Candidatus Azambacteria bacterium]|nr:radical SAM protein [Candidatus Azambacteria bacterium]